MKLELKKQVGTRWQPIDANLLLGKSICQFMMETDEVIAAALFDSGKKIAVVSNAQHVLDMFDKDKLCLMLAKDLYQLLGEQPIGEMVIKTFPDAKFLEASLLKENDNG